VTTTEVNDLEFLDCTMSCYNDRFQTNYRKCNYEITLRRILGKKVRQCAMTCFESYMEVKCDLL
jgi:hypothetical protein